MTRNKKRIKIKKNIDKKNTIEKRNNMETINQELEFIYGLDKEERQSEDKKKISFNELRKILKQYYTERPILLSDNYLYVFSQNRLNLSTVNKEYPGLPILRHTNWKPFNFTLDFVNFKGNLWLNLNMVRTCPPKQVTFSYGKDSIGLFPHAIVGKLRDNQFGIDFFEGARSIEDFPKEIIDFYRDNQKVIEELYIKKQKIEVFEQLEKREEKEKSSIELPLNMIHGQSSSLDYLVEIILEENRQTLFVVGEESKNRSILNRQYLSVDGWEDLRTNAFNHLYTEVEKLPKSLKLLVEWYREHPEQEDIDEYVSCLLDDAMAKESETTSKEENKQLKK